MRARSSITTCRTTPAGRTSLSSLSEGTRRTGETFTGGVEPPGTLFGSVLNLTPPRFLLSKPSLLRSPEFPGGSGIETGLRKKRESHLDRLFQGDLVHHLHQGDQGTRGDLTDLGDHLDLHSTRQGSGVRSWESYR